MRISAIVAMSENRVIGKQGQLPWRLPEDLKRFRAITLGHAVIMGRKTFESIGRPLPHRENIVITRQKNYSAEGVRVVGSLDDALQTCANQDEVFIIGGGEIYREAFPRIHRLHLTLIHAVIEGDASFPEFSASEFREVSREDKEDLSEPDSPILYSFLVLDRTSKF